MEKERKFIGPASEGRRLIARNDPGTRITQWYLSPEDSEHELRVRESVAADGTRYQATLKTGHGLERGESEVDITPKAAEQLQRSALASIGKTRHHLPYQRGLTIDTFHAGGMRLYSMIELEQLANEPDIMCFTMESLGLNGLIEVTGARFASNRFLAKELADLELPKPQTTDDIAEMIDQLINTSSRPIIASFSGPSASGKSTVIEYLQMRFSENAVTISTDDYYKGHTRMKQELAPEHADNFDHPASIDTLELASHLEALQNGKTILRPTYSMKTGERTGEYEEIHPAPLILLEGLVANHPQLRHYADISTMIRANPATRLARRMKRDLERTDWTAEEIMSYVMNTAEPTYIEYHQTNDMAADYCINTE
jgi:uridine kinase